MLDLPKGSPVAEEVLQQSIPEAFLEALGPHWGNLCRRANSTRFTWAAENKEPSDWIEFHQDGVVQTTFGEGTWQVLRTDDRVLVLEVGQFKLDCRLSTAGKFVVEWKGSKDTNKRCRCWTTGWPQGCYKVPLLVDSLGPDWIKLYRKDKDMSFVWAHEGREVSGWVRVVEGGILFTSFGHGTWKLSEQDPRVMEMIFGSSCCNCRLSEYGRFVVESKYWKRGGKRDRECLIVGWLESEPAPPPIEEALGPVWGKSCSENANTRFTWAHNGDEVTGWIDLQAAGVLFTSFGHGTWALQEDDVCMLELIFGTSIHRCRMSESGKFSVVEQFFKDGRKRQSQVKGWNCGLGQSSTRPPSQISCIDNVKKRRVVLVGICGPSGAGKTVLAERLASELHSPVKAIQLDWFFKADQIPRDKKWGRNWETPKGLAFDTCCSELQHLRTALEVMSALPRHLRIQVLDRHMKSTRESNILRPGFCSKSLSASVVFVIVEGFLLFYDTHLANLCDVHFWIDTDCETCERRRFGREHGQLPNDEQNRVKLSTSYHEWFVSMVWAHHEMYKDRQIKQVQPLHHVNGTDELESLVAEAAIKCHGWVSENPQQ